MEEMILVKRCDLCSKPAYVMEETIVHASKEYVDTEEKVGTKNEPNFLCRDHFVEKVLGCLDFPLIKNNQKYVITSCIIDPKRSVKMKYSKLEV